MKKVFFLLGWIYLFYKGDFETGGIHIFLCILFAFAGVFGLIFLLFLNILHIPLIVSQ